MSSHTAPRIPGSSRSVVLLGSTGSIGTQAVNVLRSHPGAFDVVALSAGGARPDLLAQQAVEFDVEFVAVHDESTVDAVQDAIDHYARLSGRPGWSPRVLGGPAAAAQAAALGADVVLNGITGAVGLSPTLAALSAGSTLALANKESLVIGGAVVRAAVRRPEQIVPVDSEHSAIAQSLRSGASQEVHRLILTASGGPFRGRTRDELSTVTLEQALQHPTWAMGPVVTINSASLMNKGLELIEAHLLFDVPVGDITVVVHPQSVVHSMVEFVDGATIVQASPPDMRLPIALGLSWPDRLTAVSPPCDWTTASTWDFEPLDDDVFPAVQLARRAAATSPLHPAVLNAANEEAVESFRRERIGFLTIVDTVAQVLQAADDELDVPFEVGLEDVLGADAWARQQARELLPG